METNQDHFLIKTSIISLIISFTPKRVRLTCNLESVKMRICLFTPYFLPGIGGVELSLHYLAGHLVRMGHKVSVLTSTRIDSPSGTMSPSGYRVYSLHEFPYPLIQDMHERMERNLHVNLSIHWEREKFDILNAHFAYPTGYIASIWGQEYSPVVVITSQGVDVQMVPEMDNYGYRYHMETEKKIRTGLTLADMATGMSHQIIKDTISAGCPEKKAVLIPNGIAADELQIPCEPPYDFPYILSLGRLDHIKGVDLLLKSFREVCLHENSIKLVITGYGPDIHSLVEQALHLGIGDRVIFTGTKTGTNKAALFQHCRFFVCPSRTESLGNANIEALACGKAVVAYRVGGIPDIIKDGENGFLVTPYDTSEFATRMRDLIQDTGLTRRMGDAGKKIAPNYDWPVIARQYLHCYNQAVKNKKKNRLIITHARQGR